MYSEARRSGELQICQYIGLGKSRATSAMEKSDKEGWKQIVLEDRDEEGNETQKRVKKVRGNGKAFGSRHEKEAPTLCF